MTPAAIAAAAPAPGHRQAVLMMAGAALAWSSAGLFTRALPLDTATMVLWRGVFGAAGLLALILVLQGAAGLRAFRHLGRAGLAYMLASGVGMLCFVGAMNNTAIANVAIIYATVPFAAALGWALLGERPTRAALIACGVALCGTAAMAGFGGDGRLAGDLLAVGMVAATAAMILLVRARPGLPTLQAAALSAVWAPLACLPFASLAGITPAHVGLLAAFGLVNTTLALALFILGSRRLRAVETALLSALETPLTPLWVWLAFAETPSLPTLAGGAIVFGAVLWFISRPAPA